MLMMMLQWVDAEGVEGGGLVEGDPGEDPEGGGGGDQGGKIQQTHPLE